MKVITLGDRSTDSTTLKFVSKEKGLELKARFIAFQKMIPFRAHDDELRRSWIANLEVFVETGDLYTIQVFNQWHEQVGQRLKNNMSMQDASRNLILHDPGNWSYSIWTAPTAIKHTCGFGGQYVMEIRMTVFDWEQMI